MNEREKLEKGINDQAKNVPTQIEQQRAAGKKLMENEATYKAEKARLAHERRLKEEGLKKELFSGKGR